MSDLLKNWLLEEGGISVDNVEQVWRRVFDMSFAVLLKLFNVN